MTAPLDVDLGAVAATRLRRLAPVRAGRRRPGRVLFFVPLAVMFVYSFWTTNANLDVVPVWTLENYANFFKNPTYVRTLLQDLIIGAAVTAICLVMAFAVAYFLARYISRRWARLALLVIIVPFWSSYLLRVYSWQAILGEKGASTRSSWALGLHRPSRRGSSSTTTSGRSSS